MSLQQNTGGTRLPQDALAAAMAVFTVKFISKAGTYTAVIQSPKGDVIQEYKSIDAQGKAQGVSPSFKADPPRLYFQCSSSRAAENVQGGMVALDRTDLTYYVNGQRLAFGSNDVCSGVVKPDGSTDSSSAFKGLFRRIDSSLSASYTYPGIEILDEVADAFGHASATIRMEAAITFGTQSDTIAADYTVTVRKAAGDSARVAIESYDNSCFAIREKGDVSRLIARVYLDGVQADPATLGATYEWFRLEYDKSLHMAVWKSLGSGPYSDGMHVCDVSDDMIDSTGLFMVEVSGLPCGILRDTQTVTDLSDPYVMDVVVWPEDLTIEEGGNQTVTFTPTLRTKSGAPVATAIHYCTIMDAAGNILNDDTANPEYTAGSPNGTDFIVNQAQCIQAGGDITVAIEATIARLLHAVDTSLGAGQWEFKIPLGTVQFSSLNKTLR